MNLKRDRKILHHITVSCIEFGAKVADICSFGLFRGVRVSFVNRYARKFVVMLIKILLYLNNAIVTNCVVSGVTFRSCSHFSFSFL